MSNTSTKFRLVAVDDLDPEQGATVEDDLIGSTIVGRYTIQAHLGGGGMAEVYRARDEQLGIDVAIKMLRPELATGEMRARLVQEARAAAQVRHPNLVRVFGTGKTTHSAYIAMELLGGPNLETYLRERPGGRLPWNEVLELLLPALAALHAVHERGDVHRDIKPGNILVAHEPGCPPRTVVIDLGLVKPDRALRDVAGPPTTEVGRVLCTPGYASPEQAAQLPVDRRSDVYSMAITLYRVLAGRAPFHNARGKPIYVWFHHHVNVDPTLLVDAAGDADIPVNAAPEQPAAPPEQPAAPRIELTAATHRELARRLHAVQVCADEDIGNLERLAVAVHIDTTGRVSAHVPNAADTTLSRCLSAVLQHRTPTPPSRPMYFVHNYNLRATTPRSP